LITGLRDPEKWNRFKAIGALKRETKQDFGYDFQAPDEERELAVKRFEEWWARDRTGEPSVSAALR
jgi:phosphoenolpyruvate carboxylase